MERKYALKGGIYQYLCYRLMDATRLFVDAAVEEAEINETPENLVKSLMNQLSVWNNFTKKILKPRERGSYKFVDDDLDAFVMLVKTAYDNMIGETQESLEAFSDNPTNFYCVFLRFARMVFWEYSNLIDDENKTIWEGLVENINKRFDYIDSLGDDFEIK